jgi:L-ascorbate metabolism protein UlaG (beta-lactamase superfamily)
MRSSKAYLFIDPYLSDHLARKYAGAEVSHVRLMPAPIRAEEVQGLDWVLCTHRHSDHMDPETLPVLARENPQCRFLVPRAEAEHAVRIGLDQKRLVTMDDGEAADLGSRVEVEAVAAAHENLDVNSRGQHHYLGYITRFGDLVVYHSGDCIPYPGLTDRLVGKGIDLALLPINGRDAYRRSKGIPGNFTFDEAVSLCTRVEIPMMIGHHFGMFEFNTVHPDRILKQMENRDADVQCYLAAVNKAYVISSRRGR